MASGKNRKGGNGKMLKRTGPGIDSDGKYDIPTSALIWQNWQNGKFVKMVTPVGAQNGKMIKRAEPKIDTNDKSGKTDERAKNSKISKMAKK